jgi:uncharacterized protein YtpQ (UPF0354 family)
MIGPETQGSNSASPAEKNPTREEFARMFMARLREAGVNGDLVFSEEDFSVQVIRPDGTADDARHTRLGNTYAEYFLVPPEQREEIVAKLVRITAAGGVVEPVIFDDAAENLLPAVRCRSVLEFHSLRAQIAGRAHDELIAEPFAVHLAVLATYATQDAISRLGVDYLTKWNVTAEQVQQAAMENLRRLPSPFTRVEGKRGVYVSAANDGYDSSRILLPERIEKLRVRGSHIAMVPAAGELCVAGSDDPKSLEILVAYAEAVMNDSPQPISGYAFRLVDGEWHRWLPAPQHYLYKRFRLLQLATAFSTYDSQRELLRSLDLQKPGPEYRHVAAFGLDYRKSPVPERSWTGWTAEGPTQLLSHADDVLFIRLTAENTARLIGPVPWKRVIEVMGDRMEPMGMYPERYRVRTFPTDHELAAMTAT